MSIKYAVPRESAFTWGAVVPLLDLAEALLRTQHPGGCTTDPPRPSDHSRHHSSRTHTGWTLGIVPQFTVNEKRARGRERWKKRRVYREVTKLDRENGGIGCG
jgi:hypothetical protein